MYSTRVDLQIQQSAVQALLRMFKKVKRTAND